MFHRLFNFLNKRDFFPYYICTPLIYSIGNASEHIYTAAAYAKRKRKKILIFKINFFQRFLKYDICNNELFDSLILNNQNENRGVFYHLTNFFIQIEFVFRRFLALKLKKYLNVDLGESFRFPLLGSRDLYSTKKIIEFSSITPLSTNECVADLKTYKKDECLRILEKYGVKDKKFVCLHVRDNSYHNDLGRREYRNSNINNYIELINFLIEKGYYVFRLGDKPAPKINYSNKNFFDLPYSELKSEIMDLFLIKECSFYVGTISGTMDTSYLFKKPTFLTNMYELFPSYPRKIEDRGIFKKVFDKKRKEYLSIKKFAELSIKYHHCEMDMTDLEFEENSPNELLEGIMEYYNLVNPKVDNTSNIILEDSQKNFNIFLTKRLKEIYDIELVKNNYFKNDSWKKNEFLRIVKRFKSCEGSLNSSYLRKNF